MRGSCRGGRRLSAILDQKAGPWPIPGCDEAEDFTSNGPRRRCPPADKRGRLPGVRYAAGDTGDQRGRAPIALFCAPIMATR
jgi:hypothetical protein